MCGLTGELPDLDMEVVLSPLKLSLKLNDALIDAAHCGIQMHLTALYNVGMAQRH